MKLNKINLLFYYVLIISMLCFSTVAINEESISGKSSDVKVYSYSSSCTGAGKQTVIYNNNGNLNTAYFFMHGDDSPGSKTYCTGYYNLCKRSEDNSGSLFVGLKMKAKGNENWIGDFDFSCLYNEAKVKIQEIGKTVPTQTILAGFSGGGNALKKIYSNNQQPSNVKATIFFDACYGSWCKYVADKETSVRGKIYAYSDEVKTLTNMKKIKGSPSVRLVDSNKMGHSEVPKNCFNDHLNQDLCQGKGKLISPDNSPVSSKITRGNEASAIPASLALYQNSPQNCQNDQQCKNIDETWLKVSNLIGGPLSGKVWDTKTNTPKDFNEVHVPPPTQTLPQTQTPTPTPTPIGNLADCKVTPINSPSSEAVGKSNDGSLKNGVLLRGSPSKYLIVLKGDKRGEHSYGTQELVNLLEYSACYMGKKYNNVKTKIHDLSLKNGGNFDPPHSSHQSGLDVDMGFYIYDKGIYKPYFRKVCTLIPNSDRKDCDGFRPDFNNPQALDANWDFIKTIQDMYDIRFIFINGGIYKLLKKHVDNHHPGEWSKYSQVIKKDFTAHHDHYHIRIKCPKGDNDCNSGHDSRSNKDGVFVGGLQVVKTNVPSKPAETSLGIVEGILSYSSKKTESSNQLLNAVANEFSQAEMIEIGKSVENRPINALKISTSGSSYRPSIFVNCAHHSNERITPEYCFQIINDLLGTDKGKGYIEKFDFWVVPIVNVDRISRKNANGVNLNRNYPFKWGISDSHNSGNKGSGNYFGPSSASEPEVKAIMNLVKKERPAIALSFHCCGANEGRILSGYTTHPKTKDPEPHIQKEFAKVMAQYSKSKVGSSTKYVLRQKLYFVSGGDQDWYSQQGSIAILPEAPSRQGRTTKKYYREVSLGFMPGFWAVLDHYLKSPRVKVNALAGTKVMAKGITYHEGEEFTTDPIHNIREVVLPNFGEHTIIVGDKERTVNVQSGQVAKIS